MADIDSLLISVTADSAKAQSALDGLASGLERMATALDGVNTSGLANIASGINQIAVAMQGISGVDKRSFTALAGKFNELNKIDGAKLQQTAVVLQDIATSFNGLSNVAMGSTSNIAELVKAVGSFGNAKVTNAITNIPQLGTALKDLFTTLSTAPAVSENIISMTTALANLASQGQKIGTATRSINTNLKSTEKSTRSASVGFKGLTSAIGKFYATYFLVIRGVKALGQAIEKSMDYTETYNYWNVALDKIKKQYGSDYKRWTEYYGNLGINSAESYADSFESRLKELVKKMSGNVIGDNGELTLGDDIGLGLDAEQLLNFQAKIISVTNSVGLLGETSVNTAKAMSMLAGDLSSLTNQDIETVMGNLQSGLIGQSRVLYKYGIDITNATLQEYALANGIQKKVSAMSQSKKMQLRVLAILDQSKVAWADQANTINSVANQYRIFKQQISNLGRTLGNLLLPIVKTILPYVNALIIVMQKLFQTLGFKLYGDSWLKDLQDGISGGAGDLDDGLDDVGDNLDGISDKVDKLKKQLQGFDELNNLTSKDDSSSSGDVNLGGGFDLSDDIADALSEYEKVWNEALEKAKNKATEIANAILNAFNKFKESDFYKSMEKLFGTLKDFTKVSFKALYDFYDKFLKPVGKWVGNKVIKKLVDLFVDFYKKINWKSLLDALGKMWQVLSKFTINIGQGFLDFVSLIAGFALDVLATTINVLAKALSYVFDVLLMVDDKFLYVIGIALGVIFSAFAISKLPTLISSVATTFTKFGTAIGNAGVKLVEFVSLNPTLIWGTVVVGALVLVINTLKELSDEIDAFTMEDLEDALKGDTSITEYAEMIQTNLQTIGGSYDDLYNSAIKLGESRTDLEETTSAISNMFAEFDKSIDVSENLDEFTQELYDFLDETESIFRQEYALLVLYFSDTPELAEETLNKFNDVYDRFINGSDEHLKKMGDLRSEFNKLSEEYKKTEDIEEYISKTKELFEQFGYSFDVDPTEIADKLEELKGSIDFSEVVENGQINTDKLNEILSKVGDTYAEETDKIKTSTQEVVNSLNDVFDSLGLSDEDKNFLISNIIDPKLNEDLQALDTELENFVGTLSTELLEKVPDVIDKAEQRYSTFSWYQKLLYPDENGYVEKAVKDMEDNAIKPFVEQTTDFLQKTLNNKTSDTSWVSDTFVEMFNKGFESTVDGVTPYEANTVESITNTLAEDWKANMEEVVENIIVPSMTNGANYSIDAFGEVFRTTGVSGKFDDFGDNLADEVERKKPFWESIGEYMATTIANKFSYTMSGFNFTVDPDGSYSSSLPKYATGGFPEDGLFMANHGELVGKFANGKTAVANNEQIEKGIANAVYNAIVNAGGFGGGNVSIRLEGDAKGLFRAVQEGAEDYTNRTGRQAFSF